VVGAADQIAKAAGFASLKNDDLWPLPGPVPGEAAVAPRIAAAIEEVENIALFRLGPAARVERCLAGVTVAFLSPGPGRLNPYQIALTGAGARVHAGRQLSDLIRGPAPDLVVLDGMTQPGSGVRAELKRLGQVVDLGLVPKLLLARRSDDPAGVVGRSDPAVSVLLSPLRLGTFLRVARRLAEE